MEVPQMLGQMILPQEPALSLARTFLVGAIHAICFVLVVHGGFVALQVGFALEGFAACFACGGGDAVAFVFLGVRARGAWLRRGGEWSCCFFPVNE